MHALAQLVAWLNMLAGAVARVLLGPIGMLPGWLSATLVAAATGVLLLAVFKYTSNQRAIKRVRDDISANLLALRLFKESTAVTLRAQGRVFGGAARLFVLALVPMLVMMVPVTLVLGQLSLWYQQRPLRVGEEAVLVAAVDRVGAGSAGFELLPSEAAETTAGPVRVPSKGEVVWRLRAQAPGTHMLRLRVGDEEWEKQLAVGDGMMPVSVRRPAWEWSEMLLHPGEAPVPPGRRVRSIELTYPRRESWTSGTDAWVVYWFVVSMISALCCVKLLKVHV